MASTIQEDITRLELELDTVTLSIKTINENGKSFSRGGRSSFNADMADLSTLYVREKELRNKIITLEMGIKFL